jgi:CcmD family protein
MVKKTVLVSWVIIFAISSLHGQDSGPDFFQQIGKMYVVVAVIVIIFLGLMSYLYRMDRKIFRLEKKLNDEK